MICKRCQAAGVKSKVFEKGTSTTLMWCAPHFDENGVRHHHDSNIWTTGYKCSNGHRWSLKYKKPCSVPNCNWPDEEPVVWEH